MKRFLILSFLIILASTSIGFAAQDLQVKNNKELDSRYFSSAEIQEDFDQLKKIVFYQFSKPYTNNTELLQFIKTQSLLLHDHMNVLELYRVFNPIVTKLNCGHTLLGLDPDYQETLEKKGNFLPLIVKVINNKKYLQLPLFSNIPKGAEIVEINGKTSEDIIHTLLSNISADGFNTTRKYYKINHAFNSYFLRFIDNQSHFRITYKTGDTISQLIIDAVTGEQLRTILNQKDDSTTSDMYSGQFFPKYAILSVRTFNYFPEDQNENYKAFIEKFFRELTDKGISNLILDLRGNGGGRFDSGAYLFSHLIREAYPFVSFNTEFTTATPFKRPVEPDQYNFKGNLYILINGGSFSMTGIICSLLKYHKIGRFIGEETGGSYLGMSGKGKIILKNTRFQIPDTRYTFEAAVSGLTPGRGIMPDDEVTPTIDDYINHRDVQLDYAIKQIESNSLPRI